ncbi:MAG TPA: hypothetical protein ENI85_04440 [Deltaproteobacteria bacterium]|nr:hypothetical protein [Deltaproteobacteria bacterium]
MFRPLLSRWLGLTILAALLSGVFTGPAPADVPEEDLDDLMGGFDDDADPIETASDEDTPPGWLARWPFGTLLYDRVELNGSLGSGLAYSYLDHSVPHGDQPGRTSHFGGLSRLDLDGFLQVDIDLPRDWQIRAEALGWYDFVYRIRGRGQYGGAVLDVYEWQVDTGEVYLTGPVARHVDLTIGRKIVNWGRSDTLRVVDVINPLDNKEPGLVDIEDLRRPKAMIKLDAISGPWSAQLLVIPENRYDRQPPRGSDFFPVLEDIPFAFQSPPVDGRSDFEGLPGLAARIDARFSGWDLSLYGAYVDETGRRIDFSFDPLVGPASLHARAEANRFGLAAIAGNWTRGAWLAKFELAYLQDIRVLRTPRPLPPPGLALPSSDDKDRIDVMVGLEYYGPDNLTIALEVVNRQLLGETKGLQSPLVNPHRSFEMALRISRPFFREKLNVTALAVAFGERFQNGAILRLSGDYELGEAWKAEAGILVFVGGPDDGLGAYDSNDRLFAGIKYSF